ncbi:YhdH/YhfP family quinone oxidoreductase [Gammaproteobacteria bacterium]|nr:YhdH/YhfP family quinone oxidoreductase [Gammaproteobacteria bacterium]
MKYKAYLVEENDGVYKGSVKEIDMPAIEPGNVIIKVHYSSLNYKDALAASGVKGVASTYPFVPGIDVAGEILESSSDLFHVGDKVIATGYKIGMKVFGGFGELVQIPAEWVISLPDNLSLKHAMSYGTAGLTAGACIKKMIDANIPKDMPIIVSGSTGGVGSVAVNLLSKLNYEVHAITGKPEEKDILLKMGAKEVIKRDEYMLDPVKPLDRGIYAGGVDTVGGDILAKMISMISNHGAISCCGNVGGMKFTSSVFPFILRGVSLIGIDSAESELEFKKDIWNLFASDWSLDLDEYTRILSLNEIENEISRILKGKQVGRVVIKHEV